MNPLERAYDVLFSAAMELVLRRRRVRCGPRVRFVGKPIVSTVKGSQVLLDRRVILVSKPRRTALGVSRPTIIRTLRRGALVRIGADSGISGATICAASRVEIGERVLIGADAIIADTDFHPLETLPRRYAPLPEPSAGDAIRIGDDVFIGARTIVLKGSTIGEGSVIGAGSVVTGSIPPSVIAAGSPCRVVRRI